MVVFLQLTLFCRTDRLMLPVMKKDKITENIGKKLGIPGIVGLLAGRLSGSELNSLLLDVFSTKLSGLSPAMLLKQYEENRFVHPAGTDMIGLLKLELRVLEFLRDHHFLPVELSPAAQLGSCSVVGPVDQKKIVSATRNVELLADATNAIALHVALLKKSLAGGGGGGGIHGGDGEVRSGDAEVRSRDSEAADETMRFCTVHRHVRTQELKVKGHTAHFKVGCMLSSGVDRGSCGWETTNLGEHMLTLYQLIRGIFGVAGKIWFRLWERGGYEDRQLLMERVVGHLGKTMGDIPVIREDAPGPNTYYTGIQFKMMIGVDGTDMEIADGGFVDWTQQLLGNRKERLLISGFGLEMLYKLQNGVL